MAAGEKNGGFTNKTVGLSSKSVSCPRKLGIQLAELGIFRQPSEDLTPQTTWEYLHPQVAPNKLEVLFNIYHFVKVRNMLEYDTVELNADLMGIHIMITIEGLGVD